MTTFSVTGLRGGKRVTVAWTDGVLTGDADAVAFLKAEALGLTGTIQGHPGGPYTMRDHLANPYTASALMQSIFVRGTAHQSAGLPPLDIPDGAIH